MSTLRRVVFAGFMLMPSNTKCFGKVHRHDTITMKNGDRLTGEVKKLEQGVLYVKYTFQGSPYLSSGYIYRF